MSQKRLWEIGATAALLLVVGGTAGGWLYWTWLNRQLAAALEVGDVSVLRRLLRQGADPHVRDSHGDTVLTCAATAGDLELVRAMLGRGLDVNEVNRDDGSTPLHQAVQHRRRAVVDLLLDAGANVDAGDADGRTP